MSLPLIYLPYLKRHISGVHDKIKPHQCATCGASFTENGKLERHISSVHEKIKPYQCSFCVAKFTEHGKLKRHISSIHDGKMPEKVIKEEKTIVDSSKIKEHNEKFLETLGNFRWVGEVPEIKSSD